MPFSPPSLATLEPEQSASGFVGFRPPPLDSLDSDEPNQNRRFVAPPIESLEPDAGGSGPGGSRPDNGFLHQALNTVREFGSSAGKYIFHGLEGISSAEAQLLANPPPEAWQSNSEEVLLPQADQAALEAGRRSNLTAAAPAAAATAGYWQQRAATEDAESGVDPALSNTIPARLGRASGSATVMSLESLVPGVGLPLMATHGASSTYAEAKNAGKSDSDAENAAVRSAIGLGIFGAANKIAALGVAKLLPEGTGKLGSFLAHFAGGDVANEATSRALSAWEASADAKPGEKVQAALSSLSDGQPLESHVLNAIFAAHGAVSAAGGTSSADSTAEVSLPIAEPVPRGHKSAWNGEHR